MADILEYKCPCCGGMLEFNSGVQQMKCPYCDSEFSIEAMQEHDAALDAQKNGDWAAYGKHLEELGEILEQLEAR